MPNIAAIDGVTGPGKRTVLIQGEIQEVTFRLGKKIIEVVNKDGSMGQYDMAQIRSIQATTDGSDFTVAVMSKEEDEVKRDRIPESAEAGAAKAAANTGGPARK